MARLIDRVRHVPGVRSAGAIRDFVFNRNPDWVVTTESGRSSLQMGGELTGEYVAIGRRFKEGGPSAPPSWVTVVGVVRDMHRGGLERRTLAEFYMPWLARNMDVIARADGDVVRLASSIRQAIRDEVPSVGIARITELGDEF
jgi:hypothetical protein